MDLAIHRLRGDLEICRQSFCRDVVCVTGCPLLLVSWNGQDHLDAVGDLKAGRLTGILQATDNIRCPTFGFEFLGDLGVENNQTIEATDACGGLRVRCLQALGVFLRA